MPRRHIAIVNLPHFPHIGVSLPVASVLVRRGYRVTYVTSERFASRVGGIGAEVVCAPSRDSAIEDERRGLGNVFCRWTDRTLPQITPFYEDNRPDLIIYDLAAFAGRILAAKWGIPAIQTSPVYALDRKVLGRQVGGEPLGQFLCDYSRSLDPYFRQFGIEAGNFFFHREKLNIFWFPKLFQPDGIELDRSFFFAGRCAGEQPCYGNWKPPAHDSRPIALVSSSTSYLQGTSHFRMCIEAFAGLPWHVILSIGDHGDPSSFDLPPHFEIVKHNAHVNILPHADLFVYSGGAISTAEAAYHGVPSIATTHGSSELEWLADGFQKLGLGIHLRKAETNVENLRAAIVRISDDTTIRRSVKEIRRAVLSEPGGEETANRIEEFIESSSIQQ